MAEDLAVALSAEIERQVADADRVLRCRRIPEIARELAGQYLGDAVAKGLIVALARHLGEQPRAVALGVALACADGRHVDELLRAELLAPDVLEVPR